MIINVAGVQGHCESGFGRVADVFATQLESGRDIGGSVGRGVPWTEHTVTPIGSKHGYHAVTYGFIISGLVRAIAGRTVGEFFADEVAPMIC
jgi:CubicO group peptidase (beta-lactamase class C family)